MDFLSVKNISKQRGRDFSLYPVSFSLQKGQKLAFAGATGSGKSTLMKIIGGLAQPDSGEVRFEGKRVLGPDEKLLPGHPGIGYLSQYFELRNNYTVAEELDYANLLSQSEAEAIYAICRISHLLHRRTDQLSGGEKQRIVTARLLTTKPRLLLLDEPYSNLDVDHRQVMKDMIRDIMEQLGTTCILISHEPMDTLSWADEILVLRQGKIVQQGTPQQIYHQPVNAYVAGLFGKFTLLEPALAALFSVQEIQQGKNLLIRPEYFSLSTNQGQGVAAIVQNVTFYGTHYELDVAVNNLVIPTRTAHSNIKEGQKVYVSLTANHFWWL